MIDKISQNKYKIMAPVAGALVMTPAFAWAEEASPTIQSTVTNMATSVATDAQAMLIGIIPAVAPIVVAVIVATLGFKFVNKFARAR